jgi:hypothetical protein
MTYEQLLPALRDELASLGVSAVVLSYADKVNIRPTAPVAALSIKSCSISGEDFDVVFSLSLLSPRSFGASGCALLFTQLSNAVSALSSAFGGPVLACGDTSFDTKTDCFVCRATLSTTTVASEDSGDTGGEGVFIDFNVMGVEILG